MTGSMETAADGSKETPYKIDERGVVLTVRAWRAPSNG
jgi:hypothetical protein